MSTSVLERAGAPRAIGWPDPPMPGPDPTGPAGTPGLADGRVFVQIAQPSAPYVWGGSSSRWGNARWGVLTPDAIADATCDVRGCSIQRGRDDALDPYPPARFTATLDDPDFRWGPTAVDGTGLRLMRVGVPLRVVALDLDETTVVTLFAGTVSKCNETDDGTYPPVVSLEALGTFGSLGSDRITPPPAGAGELAGARMSRVLAASHYRADWWGAVLAPGEEPLLEFEPIDPGADAGEGPTALELLQTVADSDGGSLLEEGDGTVRYLAPGELETRTVRFRFTDQPTTGGTYDDVCPVAITFHSDAMAIVNAVAVRSRGAADDAWRRAADDVSISWVGRRPVEVDDLLYTNPTHGDRLAQHLLSRAVRDEFRVSPLQGEALTLPGWWPVALHLELGDPVLVIRNHGTARVQVNALTQSLRHDITRRAWAVEVGLGAANMRSSYSRWSRNTSRWGKARWA